MVKSKSVDVFEDVSQRPLETIAFRTPVVVLGKAFSTGSTWIRKENPDWEFFVDFDRGCVWAKTEGSLDGRKTRRWAAIPWVNVLTATFSDP